MRYGGNNYTGKGVRIAVVDSGINADDPRLAGTKIEGLNLEMSATQHVMVGADFTDHIGHGTLIAAAIHKIAPDATLFAVKIMGERLRTSADLMGAGLEISAKHGCRIINLSLGTDKMGKAMTLSDCVGNAVEMGSLVLSQAHPKGDQYYPADIPNTVGVNSHPDCPIDKYYYFDPKHFPRKHWGRMSDKFLAHGLGITAEGGTGRYRGPGLATAYLTGYAACLAEALPHATTPELLKKLKQSALRPMPGLGYA